MAQENGGHGFAIVALNESPSEKEGKFPGVAVARIIDGPSMKVPPKRKGNSNCSVIKIAELFPSMKVPPKRKGNVAWAVLKSGKTSHPQ